MKKVVAESGSDAVVEKVRGFQHFKGIRLENWFGQTDKSSLNPFFFVGKYVH